MNWLDAYAEDVATFHDKAWEEGYSDAIDKVKEFRDGLDALSERKLIEACDIILGQLEY